MLMKTKLTLRNFFFRKEGWLSVFLLAVFTFFGCYEFYTIDQPTEGYTNDTFSVPLVVKQDDDPTNDWTVDGLQGIGLFGVLIPEGWTVDDSIYYSIVCADSAYNSDGQIVYADHDYSNDGYLLYSESQSKMLTDSIGAPTGYVWWGAKTDRQTDMTFFDSLYFSINVNTDAQTGTFYLQYAIGDDEYIERVPSHYVSDPIPIEITENPNTGINNPVNKEISVYPNPSDGLVNIDLGNMKSRVYDMKVYNMNGKLVMSRKVNQTSTSVDLSGNDPGTYFIRLSAGSEEHNFKILLQ
jgi:hypothetical protein